MRRHPGHGMARGAAAALVLACTLASAGCAASRPRQFLEPGVSLGDRPRTAFLPLDNLTEQADEGRRVNEIFFVEFARSGVFDPVESGEVLAALRDLRVRYTASLSNEQIQALGERLGARYLLLGTILECGTAPTRDGPVPAVGVSLRLIDVGTRRLVWTDAHIRTGEDREGVFGWGREESFERLVTGTATEMFDQLRKEALDPSRAKGRS